MNLLYFFLCGARGKILPQLAPVLSGGGGLGFARVKRCLYRGEARSLRHHLSRILNLRDSRSLVEGGFCGAAVAVPSPSPSIFFCADASQSS